MASVERRACKRLKDLASKQERVKERREKIIDFMFRNVLDTLD